MQRHAEGWGEQWNHFMLSDPALKSHKALSELIDAVSPMCRFNIDLCSNCEALSQYVDDAGMSNGSPAPLPLLCCPETGVHDTLAFDVLSSKICQKWASFP